MVAPVCALLQQTEAATDSVMLVRVVQGMRKGVKESAAFILFLSAGVLLRPVRAQCPTAQRPLCTHLDLRGP